MPGLKSWIRRLFGYAAEPAAQSQPSEPASPAPGAVMPAAPDLAGTGAAAADSAVSPMTQAKSAEEDAGVQRRARLAAEAIMENESLMPDLDSSTAQVLLEWGLELVRKVAASSAGLTDVEAEEAMAARMRATRQLMRTVNNWVGRAGEASPEADAQAMEKIVENLSVIYREQIAGLDAPSLQEILREIQDLRQDPARWVASLRQSLESRAAGQE